MSCWMSGRLVSAEGRRQTAVAHLALARSLNCRNRHFGLLIEYTKDFVKNKRVLKVRKRKGAALMVAPYYIIIDITDTGV
jgi:hypothetical protein